MSTAEAQRIKDLEREVKELLQIAPSAYRRHAARWRQPELRSARAQRDDLLVL